METLTKFNTENTELQPEETSHAAIIHISSLASFIIPFGSILGPLIFWMIWRDQSKFVDHNGKQALNFNISIVIYQIVLLVIGLVMFLSPFLMMMQQEDNPVAVLMSLPGLLILLSGLGLLSIVRYVLIVIAAIKSGDGNWYRYPLTIQFFK